MELISPPRKIVYAVDIEVKYWISNKDIIYVRNISIQMDYFNYFTN